MSPASPYDSLTVDSLIADVTAEVEALTPELTEVRRDLHAHPELAWHESRTTAILAKRLDEAGLVVTELPQGGLMVDIDGTTEEGPRVALRADLDALPVEDLTEDPWRSTVPGAAHACGHDLHSTALLGAGLALARVADRLPTRVRLVFQPAEEAMPGGALTSMAAGVLDGVDRIFMLHCDPTVDVGQVGLRVGPVTGAADTVEVRLAGRGGHTSRPHLTEDLTFALAKVVTELPAVLSRRIDPRSGASLVWGLVQAGSAANVIPRTAVASGTLRMLDPVAWESAESLVRDVVEQLLAPYGVQADVGYRRGVPPVVNEPTAAAQLALACHRVLGPDAVVPTSQSLGGEDFAWYLGEIPGAMGRLGTRTPGGPTFDLHQGDLRVDERAVAVGASVLAATAISAGPSADGARS